MFFRQEYARRFAELERVVGVKRRVLNTVTPNFADSTVAT